MRHIGPGEEAVTTAEGLKAEPFYFTLLFFFFRSPDWCYQVEEGKQAAAGMVSWPGHRGATGPRELSPLTDGWGQLPVTGQPCHEPCGHLCGQPPTLASRGPSASL